MNRVFSRYYFLSVLILCCFAASQISTATVLQAIDGGCYDAHGKRYNGYYLAGKYHDFPPQPFVSRNWFVFDVPRSLGKTVAAKLRIYTAECQSPNKEEIFQLNEIRIPIPTLRNSSDTKVIYEDLADGKVYGSRKIAVSEKYQYVTIDLNANFLEYVNRSRGATIALGGSISSLNFGDSASESLFLYANSVSGVELILVGDAEKPIIVKHPEGQAADVGGTATFSVSALSPTTASYQWRHNGINISGATRSILKLTGLNPSQEGEYSALVGNSYGKVISSNAPLHVIVRPENDNFTNRISLSGTNIIINALTSNATSETNEPDFVMPQSVWWTWTAPHDGLLYIDSSSELIKPYIGVFGGDELSSLVSLTEIYQSEPIVLLVTGGVSYQILAGADWMSTNDFQLNLRFEERAGNDEFVHRHSLTATNIAIVACNFGATKETNEPDHGHLSGNASVWWTWIAPENGIATVHTYLNSSAVAVYSGDSLETLIPAGKGDNVVRFIAIQGTAYSIAVDLPAPNYFAIDINETAQAVNDSFSDRILLSGNTIPLVVDLSAATAEESDPVGGPSLWWSWTAPETGVLTIKETYPEIHLFKGDSPSSLIPVTHVEGAGQRFGVTAGVTYQIEITGTEYISSPINMNLQWKPGPSNDLFENRIPLVGTNLTVTGNNADATIERGEHYNGSDRASVWWTFTAPTNGTVKMPTAGLDLLFFLTVYSGTSVSNLTWVADNTCGEIVFKAEAGKSYQISLTSYGAHLEGDFGFYLHFFSRPSNDDFVNAIPLSGEDAPITGYTDWATLDTDDPDHRSASVWFTWTAPATGILFLDNPPTSGFNYDLMTADSLVTRTPVNAKFFVYRENVGLGFSVEAGKTYYLQIWNSGFFASSLHLQLPATNDSFSNPALLEGTNFTSIQSTLFAGLEAGEPEHSMGPKAYSLWWSYTPATNCLLFLDVKGYGPSNSLAVYEGQALNELTCIASNNIGRMYPPYYGTNNLKVALSGGKTYYIAVVGVSDYVGDINLHLESLPSPANDLFDNRAILVGTNAVFIGSNINATTEPGEIKSGFAEGGSTLWFTWTAPIDGTVKLDASGSSIHAGIAVFEIDSENIFHFYAQNSDILNNFNVRAGEVLEISVGSSYPGEQGQIVLHLMEEQLPPSFYSSPEQRTVFAGESIDIYADFLGYWADSYQWQLNGKDIPGATDWWINLANVQTRDAGVYALAIKNPFGSTIGAVTLLNVLPIPTNDSFTNASRLSGTDITLVGSTVDASEEAGEELFAVGPAGVGSVWWRWKAPMTGPVTIDTVGSMFDTSLYVFTGNDISSLKLVTFNDDCGEGNISRLTFNAVAGQEYKILLDGTYQGAYRLHLVEAKNGVPLVTHHPANQTVSVGSTITFFASASGAGPLRYQWRFNGRDIPNATTMKLTVPNVALEQSGGYGVRVENPMGKSYSSNAWLTVRSNVRAGNDLSTHPQTIQGTNVVRVSSSINASMQDEYPFDSIRSLWWKWQAPADGLVAVDTIGTAFDTYVAIYSGNASAYWPIESEGSTIYGKSHATLVTFTAVAGETYYIQISGLEQQAGTVFMHLQENINRHFAPLILQQPFSQVVNLNEAALLSVIASGTESLHYQWLHNGIPMRGQTNSTLTLSNVQTRNAGTYRVTVSNDAGRVTSDRATLTVTGKH